MKKILLITEYPTAEEISAHYNVIQIDGDQFFYRKMEGIPLTTCTRFPMSRLDAHIKENLTCITE